MEKYELTKFAKLMAAIGTLHGKDLPPAVIEIYWQSLKRFSWLDLQHALQAHINNPDGGQFMPKPADIIRQLEGSGAAKAAHAWVKVDKAINQIGSYTSVVFDDPIIHAAIEYMGGWVKLCQSGIDQLKFRQIEFEHRYQHFLLRRVITYPRVLSGYIEACNARDGYSIPPPTFVGDKDRAQQVMRAGGGSTLAIHEPDRRRDNVSPMRQALTQRHLP